MKIVLIFATLITASISHAFVDMRNANYSETWLDINVEGASIPLRVQRAYNSRSLFNGIFGFGWCSEIETSLELTAEGNIRIRECGDGAELVYRPKDFGKEDVNDSVTKILAAHRAENPNVTSSILEKLRSELISDRATRDEYAKKYKILGKIVAGKRYFANGRENESILREDAWYTRALTDGTVQRFDLLGRLILVSDKAGNTSIKFTYSKDLMTEMSDNSGRKLSFSYHSFKKVRRIDGPNRQFANYEYDGLKDLKMARTFDGAVYNYQYDDLHNLTQVTLPDKTSMKLSYDKNKDWVTSFTDRLGCTEKYEWILSKEDPKNNYHSTLVKTCDGRVVVRSKFEFWFKQRPDGDGKYLARTVIKNNGDDVDTTYHPQFNKPTVIKRGGMTINYDYFPNGLVSVRTQGKDITKYKYDDSTKKVSEVRNGNRVTGFKYDSVGNLISAQSSDGLSVTLAYDGKGRITNIADQAKRVVRIQYEEKFGKPKLVERPGVGAIEFIYKPDGKVKEVKSQQGGPTVAVQVASTFNSLLELVAPAGVDLGI